MTEREIQVRIAERNDQGSTPELNRDALGHASLFAGNLLVLATGVGGSGSGRVEANLAVSTILTQFRQAQDAGIPHRLAAALSHANDVLRTRASSERVLVGSGASVAVALVRDNQFWAARAGDVRVLIVRGERAIDAVGVDEPAEHEQGAAAVGALGAGQHARIVVSRDPIRLVPGDRIVLAAPGLHAHVDTVRIGRVVSTLPAQEAVGTLVESAQKAGAKAGVSIQLLQYGDAVPAEVTAAAPGRARATAAQAGPGAVATKGGGMPPQDPQWAPEPRGSEPKGSEPREGSGAERGPDRGPEGRTTGGAEARGADVRLPEPRKPARPTGAQALEPTEPGWRETSLGDLAPPPRGGREPLPSLGGDARRNTVVAFGIAVAALLALLVWRPWSSTTDTASTAEEGVEAPAAEGVALVPAEQPEETPLIMDEVIDEALVPPSDALPTGESFWARLDQALDAGDPITEAAVRAWLAGDGADVPAAAAARRAQLRLVDKALAGIAGASGGAGGDVAAEDRTALDRVFAAAPADAAAQLEQWIVGDYAKRADGTFEVVSAWLRANRTPKAFAVIAQLSQRKVRSKTRAWVDNAAPLALLGE
ncbi:MAG: hypothetical protein AMXMBFR64_49240 [Myxococcales bacterium]